jgi:hypothetical protein
MAALPTSIRPPRMLSIQPHYIDNRRPCPADEFRWKTEDGVEAVGLPKTSAGIPYFPTDLGIGWLHFEYNVASIDKVYRRSELLFRNRDEEIWQVLYIAHVNSVVR